MNTIVYYSYIYQVCWFKSKPFLSLNSPCLVGHSRAKARVLEAEPPDQKVRTGEDNWGPKHGGKSTP